jgi:hypothetical protein
LAFLDDDDVIELYSLVVSLESVEEFIYFFDVFEII